MNEDSIRLIKIWILDHACKHGIDSLIKLIVKDASIEDIFGTSSPETQMNMTFLFSYLLNNFIKSLKVARHDKVNKYTSWNKRLLILITELLISTYKQEKYISLKRFLNLITRLKRMELICYLFENVPNTVIVERLNASLPRWDPPYEIEIQKLYNLNEKVLKTIKEGHVKFRRFILPLTVSSSAKQSYVANNLGNDIKAFINNSLPDLLKISSVIKVEVEPSMIEKIILQTPNKQYEANPAIQIVLEYIQTDMKESDFAALLYSFDPNSQLCADDGFIDTISEFGSEADPSCVEMCTSSEDEDDENNPETVRKVILQKDRDLLKGLTGQFVPTDDLVEVISDSEENT